MKDPKANQIAVWLLYGRFDSFEIVSCEVHDFRRVGKIVSTLGTISGEDRKIASG